MEKSSNQGKTEIILKTSVSLDPEVLEKIKQKLSASLGREVRLNPKVDRSVKGMVIYLDEQHQFSLDLTAPMKELEKKLALLPMGDELIEERARQTIRTIETYKSQTGIKAGETNLKKALEDLKGSHILLQCKVHLDDSILEKMKEKLSAAAGRELFVDLKVNPRMESGAVLYLGEDKRVVLDTRYKWLADLERCVSEKKETGFVERDEASLFIRETIEKTEPRLQLEEVQETGNVLEVGDGVALISGLKNVGSQELVEFECGVYGIVFSLFHDKVGCILLGPEEEIREGSEVVRTGHLMKVPVGEALVGRIINATGKPVDGKGPIEIDIFNPVEKKAPGIIDRHPVVEPLHTGIKVLDALVPLGRGQRELIIGDRKIGKTTMVVDTILSQKNTDVYCVYASIGQKASSVARVVRTLEEYGALEYTTIVVALPNEQPAFRYITPYTACAIGEYFMEQGRHALVIYDDLSKHAVTYREMSALLKRPIGREAYPGDIFYIHSRLLERAARLSNDLGGGSLTALPIVETLAGDISAFIPTNVISICDGQIFLDTNLFNEGFRPSMDVGLSVSRVGGSAQTKAMKKVAGRLRIDLAQYQEMAQFVKFGAEVDQTTLDQLTRGERGRELLIQPQHLPLSMEHEIVILYAVINGYLDDVPLDQVANFEEKFFKFMNEKYPAVLQSINETKELLPATEGELKAAALSFKEVFQRQSAKENAEGGLTV